MPEAVDAGYQKPLPVEKLEMASVQLDELVEKLEYFLHSFWPIDYRSVSPDDFARGRYTLDTLSRRLRKLFRRTAYQSDIVLYRAHIDTSRLRRHPADLLYLHPPSR